MSNFIGKMSRDEFIEALKIIISREDDIKEEKDTRTFGEKLKSFIEETVDDVKYIFSGNLIKDLFKGIYDIAVFIYNLITFKIFKDLKNYVDNLTQDEFIKVGKKIKAILIEVIETIIFVIVMVIIIRFFVGEIRWIPSGSMHPTLLEGDRIYVDRSYRFKTTPKRGDIMVFYPPFEKLKNTPWKVFSRLTGFFCKDIAYIKRVVGMPGDKFEIKSDNTGKYTVYINDKPLDEPYIQSPYDYTPCTEAMMCGPAVIPEGHYLMLGDNRGNSQDGRYWGLLPQDRFIGRAVFVFWPFSRAKTLH